MIKTSLEKFSLVVKASPGAFLFGRFFGKGTVVPVENHSQGVMLLEAHPNALKAVSSLNSVEISVEELRKMANMPVARIKNGPAFENASSVNGQHVTPPQGYEGLEISDIVGEEGTIESEEEAMMSLEPGDSFPPKNCTLKTCKAFADAYSIEYNEDITKQELYAALKELFGIDD